MPKMPDANDFGVRQFQTPQTQVYAPDAGEAVAKGVQAFGQGSDNAVDTVLKVEKHQEAKTAALQAAQSKANAAALKVQQAKDLKLQSAQSGVSYLEAHTVGLDMVKDEADPQKAGQIYHDYMTKEAAPVYTSIITDPYERELKTAEFEKATLNNIPDIQKAAQKKADANTVYGSLGSLQTMQDLGAKQPAAAALPYIAAGEDLIDGLVHKGLMTPEEGFNKKKTFRETVVEANIRNQPLQERLSLLNGAGKAPSGDTVKERAVNDVLKAEGGFVANDAGKGPTNFGINQTANPDLDVKNITREQAKQRYSEKYWNAINGDNLPPQMAYLGFNASVNMGSDRANKLLEQSGGDPEKFVALQKEAYRSIAKNNPEKAKYLDEWMSRTDKFAEQSQAYAGSKNFGNRPDGTPKGTGFLGVIKKPDGIGEITEVSVGVNIGGKEMDIPTVVPSLTKQEVSYLAGGGKPTDAIIQKAVDHAKQRMAAGKSVYASNDESPGTSPSVTGLAALLPTDKLLSLRKEADAEVTKQTTEFQKNNSDAFEAQIKIDDPLAPRVTPDTLRVAVERGDINMSQFANHITQYEARNLDIREVRNALNTAASEPKGSVASKSAYNTVYQKQTLPAIAAETDPAKKLSMKSDFIRTAGFLPQQEIIGFDNAIKAGDQKGLNQAYNLYKDIREKAPNTAKLFPDDMKAFATQVDNALWEGQTPEQSVLTVSRNMTDAAAHQLHGQQMTALINSQDILAKYGTATNMHNLPMGTEARGGLFNFSQDLNFLSQAALGVKLPTPINADEYQYPDRPNKTQQAAQAAQDRWNIEAARAVSLGKEPPPLPSKGTEFALSNITVPGFSDIDPTGLAALATSPWQTVKTGLYRTFIPEGGVSINPNSESYINMKSEFERDMTYYFKASGGNRVFAAEMANKNKDEKWGFSDDLNGRARLMKYPPSMVWNIPDDKINNAMVDYVKGNSPNTYVRPGEKVEPGKITYNTDDLYLEAMPSTDRQVAAARSDPTLAGKIQYIVMQGPNMPVMAKDGNVLIFSLDPKTFKQALSDKKEKDISEEVKRLSEITPFAKG